MDLSLIHIQMCIRDRVGTEFDQDSYENSADLQKNAMKAAYGEMEYEIGNEKVEDGKATVTVCLLYTSRCV